MTSVRLEGSSAAPALPAALAAAVASAVETAINGALALDAVALARVGRLQDRRLRIISSSPGLSLTLTFTRTGVRCAGNDDTPVDTEVSGPATALLSSLNGAALPESIAVRGDGEFVVELRELAATLAPDVLAPVRHTLGIGAAGAVDHALRIAGNASRMLFKGAATAASKASRNAAAATWTDHDSLDQFAAKVDALTLAMDRAEATMNAMTAGSSVPGAPTESQTSDKDAQAATSETAAAKSCDD